MVDVNFKNLALRIIIGQVFRFRKLLANFFTYISRQFQLSDYQIIILSIHFLFFGQENFHHEGHEEKSLKSFIALHALHSLFPFWF